MQFKTMLRYLFTCIWMVIMEKTISVGENVKELEPSYIVYGKVNCAAATLEYSLKNMST